jgi:hypothetical protein
MDSISSSHRTLFRGSRLSRRIGPKFRHHLSESQIIVITIIPISLTLVHLPWAQEKFIQPVHPGSWFLLFFNNLGNLHFVQT